MRGGIGLIRPARFRPAPSLPFVPCDPRRGGYNETNEREEKVMGKRIGLLAIAVSALVLALGSTAQAVEVAAPGIHITPNQVWGCSVTNAGPKATPVVVKLIDFYGVEISSTGNCTFPVPAFGSCVVNPIPQDTPLGYCHVTTSSTQVRAAVSVYQLWGGDL